jgi:O-antigen/teichoic acid export membrane protein
LGKLFTIALFCLGLLSYDFAFGFFRTPDVLAPFLLLCIGWDASAFLGNALRTRLNFVGDFLIKIIANGSFLTVLTTLSLIDARINIAQVLWLQAASFVPACLLGFYWTLQGVERALPATRHAKRGLLSLARIGTPMALAASVGVGQVSIDSIVLGAGAHMEVNASFTLVNRLGQMAQLPVNILIFSGLPYIVDALRGGKVPDKNLLHIVVALLIGSAIVVANIFILANEWLVPFALGPQYSDVVYFAPWMGFYIIPLYIYPLYSNLLSAMRRVVVTQAISALATIMNLLLDIFVIRLHGPYAVAWVAGSMHWVLLTAFAGYYRWQVGYWPMSKTNVVFAIFGGAAILLPAFFMTPTTLAEGLMRSALALSAAGGTLLILSRNGALLRRLLSR